MTVSERIPFRIEVQRVIEVLASQIYQSPLALLRENTQNAFDAILLRQHRGDSFVPTISLAISASEIVVSDNGIGMTPGELRSNFWSAGSSSKNTPDARAAGVVGTFGIGAMANFGVANLIEVTTESAVTGERTRSVAQRDTLSLTKDCIEMESLTSGGEPGTTVTARIDPASPIDVTAAESYINEFIAYVRVAVIVNGVLRSQGDLTTVISSNSGWQESIVGIPLGDLIGDVTIRIAAGTGEVTVEAVNVRLPNDERSGRLMLKQGVNTVHSYRSGFGLAVLSLSSSYQFGGAIDLPVLEPTAGREALSTGSMQMLQNVFTGVDRFVSETIAARDESDLNTCFMSWVQAHGRYELCDNLKIRVEPNRPRMRLGDARTASLTAPLRVYAGSDVALVESLASEDAPLFVLAGVNPRRQCETEFIRTYCQAEQMSDLPSERVRKEVSEWTLEEQAIVFRIVSVLDSDYFLPLDVGLAALSHGLPVLLVQSPTQRLSLDPAGSTFTLLVGLYNSDYSAFGSMVKDFVRNVVFPQVAGIVPSATRQGAESFLSTIRRTRDVFEVEYDDLGDFKSIWTDLVDGRLSIGEAAAAAAASATRTSQILDASAALPISAVVPDIVRNEAALGVTEDGGAPLPAIMRREVDTEAKLLTIGESEAPLNGYRCFLALSDKAREDRGDFFLQPHTTSIVWGGQRVLFVFQHHAGTFGLYYDLQTSDPVSAVSGGGRFPTSTIALGNRIFIPVPEEIARSFVPTPTSRKRFGVRCDLIYSGTDDTNEVEPS